MTAVNVQPVFATSGGLDTPTGSGDMPFAIQGVQIMDLTGTGLGIGTVTPLSPLDVRTGSDQRILFRGPISGSSGTSIGSVNDANTAWQPLEIDGSVTILGMAGSVGIGTTAPAYKLEVSGDIRANGWMRTLGQAGWYSETYGGGWYMTDATWIRSYNSKPMYESAGFDTGAPSGVGCGGGLGGGYTMHICGSMKLDSSLTFPDGTVQTTAPHPPQINYAACSLGSASGGWAPIGGWHYMACPSGKVMVGMQYIGGDGTNTTSAYNFTPNCCPLM